jgi:hypothetical protein
MAIYEDKISVSMSSAVRQPQVLKVLDDLEKAVASLEEGVNEIVSRTVDIRVERKSVECSNTKEDLPIMCSLAGRLKIVCDKVNSTKYKLNDATANLEI